jgi:hypothetical protein
LGVGGWGLEEAEMEIGGGGSERLMIAIPIGVAVFIAVTQFGGVTNLLRTLNLIFGDAILAARLWLGI